MKKIIIGMLSICYLNCSFSQSFKFILSINDEIARKHDVCNISILTKDGGNFILEYDIVELIFNDSIGNKLKEVDDNEDILITINYLCKHFTNANEFNVNLKSYFLKRDYIILRIYTRNYKGAKKLYFPDGTDYVYEYDCYSVSSRVPLKRSFIQRLLKWK